MKGSKLNNKQIKDLINKNMYYLELLNILSNENDRLRKQLTKYEMIKTIIRNQEVGEFSNRVVRDRNIKSYEDNLKSHGIDLGKTTSTSAKMANEERQKTGRQIKLSNQEALKH